MPTADHRSRPWHGYAVYADVSRGDRERVKEIARQQRTTMSALIREALNDLLEQLGEKPLSEERRRTLIDR